MTEENNQFGDIATQLFKKEPEQKVKVNMDQAFETNPDQYAESYNLAQEESLPVQTVENNMPEVKKRSQRRKLNNQYEGFLEENPKLVEFLQVPENARLSFDEIDKLGAFERTFKTFGKAFDQGVATNQLGRTAFFQNSGLKDFEIADKQIENLERILADQPEKESFLNDWVYPAAKIIGQVVDTGEGALIAGAGTASIAAVAGQAGPQVAAPEEIITVPAAFIAGSTAYLATDAYMIESGHALLELSRIEEEQGQKFDPLVKQGAAAFVGVANAALEMVGIKFAAAPFRQAFGKWVKKEGSEVLIDQTKAQAVKKFAKDYAKAVGAETATEIMQEGVNIFAEEVAQSISFEDFETILNDPERADEAFDRMLAVGSEVFRGMALLGVVGPSANFSVDYAKSRKAQRNKEMMEAIGTDAKDSKLLQRVPQKYKEFVAAAKQGAEDVYISASKFQTYFQSQGIDPAQVAQELGIQDQIQEASETGGDLVIPLENYSEKMAATEHHDQLINDLKFSPDDMTFTEADQLNANIQDVLREQYEIAEQEQFDQRRKAAPADRVYDEVFSQLRTSGRTIDVAEKEAVLWKSFFDTMGERAGTDAYSLFKKQNINITQELPPALQNKSVTEMDLMIEKYKSFKGLSQNKLFGSSLIEYINGLGGVSANDVNASDLEALGIEDWHKEKKFRKRVLNENGRALDDVALSAWEAGYFPEFTDRPSINDLIDKIELELKVQPQFAEGQGDLDLQAEASQIEDLDRFFNDLGIDPNTQTNDEIKEIIANFEEGQRSEGKEFFQDEKDLIAQHNLSLDNLRNAQKLGGLPVPSLAITKKDAPLANFGEITLLGDKNLIDPRADRTNKVFAADIYSPRYPSINYEVDVKSLNDEMSSTLKGLDDVHAYFDVNRIEDNGRRSLEESGAVALKFLKENGKRVPRKQKYNDGKISHHQTARAYIEAAKKIPEYQQFVDELFDNVIARERIFDGFTYSGNRKYLSHNVENVVRVMKRGLNDGEGFNYGVGSIRAVFTKKFRSVDQIKKSKDKLVTEEEFTNLKEEVDGEFMKLADRMQEKLKFESNSFSYLDTFSEHLKEAAEVGVPKVLNQYYEGFDQSDVNEVAGFLKKLEDFPTEYFEAKLQRAVGIGEFEAAVVPRGKRYNEAVNILKQSGVKDIRRYTEGDAESRTQAVGKFEKLFFQKNDKKRGSFSFNEQGEKVIKLFESADLSTILHESGHFFFEVMGELSQAENATQDIKDDYAQILKFLEVDSADQIGTEQHEKFARAFEAYAFEGKAPSVELESAFRRFKQWLVSIYRNIQKLDVELNDDIRGVFDRMLATDEQIKTSEELSAYFPVLKDKETGGMTQAEYESYLKSAERATTSAENDLLKKAMNEIKRERLQWWKDEKAKTKEGVTQEVMQQPTYQALHFLQKGEFFEGGTPNALKGLKLDTTTLQQLYGKEVFKLLPKSVPPIYKKGGAHPDAIAEVFGFDSGDALVKALWNAQNINQLIEEKTQQNMKERHGDILNDGSIEEEAVKSIRTEDRATFLATELKALSKRGNKEIASPKEVAKKAAQRFISETEVKDLQLGKYAAAEVRAAKNAQQAVADGDFNRAIDEKRKQLFNHYLFIEARKAQERVDKIQKYMTKFNKKSIRERLGKARGNYLEQIDSLLERFDFRRSVSIKSALKRESLSKWIDKQREEGNDVVISDKLENEAFRKSFKLMTTEELFGLEDTVRNIEHLARTKNKLLDSKDKREFNEVVGDIVSTIEENNKLKAIAPDYAPTYGSKIKKGVGSFFAKHTKMEFLFEQLDGHKNLGTTWTALFKPLADAEVAEQALMTQVTKKLNNAFKQHSNRLERAKWYIDKVHVDGVSQSFNKASLISLALNWGNEGNRQAIREGNGWSDAQVREILDNLEKKDWVLVQEIWDTIDSLWPQAKEVHKDVTGVAPPKVEGVPVETKHGTFKGGYYPLKYDSEFSFFAFKREQAESTQGLFGSNWIRPQTKQGHLQERVGSAGQRVKLDLSVMTEHLSNTIHDVTHRKALMDVDRITRSPRVRDVIERAAGKEMYRQIRPWLQTIANDRREPVGAFEGILGRLRVGATVVNMGWKVTTAIVQPLGYLQSVDLLGEKYGWVGLKKFYGSPAKMREGVNFVMERSGMMQNRQKTFDRDVRDTLKKTTLKGTSAEIQQSFFYFTGLMDMSVAVPTWLGAYEKSMNGDVDGTTAGNEAQAIDFADKTVRMSQSAGGAKDLADIQTGAEYHRIYTMFYSYFNVLYNLLRRRGQLTNSKKDIPRLAASMMYLWFAPAILSELVAGRGPEDEDEWAEWAATNAITYPFQTIVGVRDGVNAMFTKYGYDASPAFDGAAETFKTFAAAGKVFNDDDFKRSDAKSAVLAASYWGQLPGRQVWITSEYLYDYATGEEDEFSFRDLVFTRKK